MFGADQAMAAPEIRRIQVVTNEIIITVDVPEGVKVVTLEGRVRFGKGVWIPRGIKRPDGSGTQVEFRLPNNERFEVFRVKGEASSALPTSFFQGTNSFAGAEGSNNGQGTIGNVTTGVTYGATDNTTAATPETGQRSDREVVESDIWRIEGDRLYFFNQFRGLQIIDIAIPDQPSLTGTVSMPAAGEQMYALPDAKVVLLAHDNCGWWGSQSESQLVIVDAAGMTPTILTNIPVSGRIQESRLVGSALYVASEYYRYVELPLADGSVSRRWEWGTRVSSFDLSDPNNPITRDEKWFPGYDNVIHATQDFLFVSVRGADLGSWWKSEIHIFDISSPDGTMLTRGIIHPAGRVRDKFKMDLQGNRFTVISEARTSPPIATHLENYDLSDPANPTPSGSLQLANGESLFATRFDGNKVYIVTFLRIDPLWIVDLTNPTNPRVLGELEVPGWSTYIQPYGDRLVTVGVDDQGGRRVSISLFDVADPAQPALLSRVPLGENYSWSEANYDEKAFGFLPNDGLILVPFQTSTTNGYSAGVQIIDFSTSNLTARGFIAGTNKLEYTFRPRRSTLHGDRILSLSGNSLLSVDATDRDQPRITDALPLAWSVDRVLLHEDHLLEFEIGNSWSSIPGVIRVTPKSNTELVLTNHSLNGQRVLGIAKRAGQLYVASIPADAFTPYQWWYSPAENATTPLTLEIYDLASLPELPRVGSISTNLTGLILGSEFSPLWISDTKLVWHGASGQGFQLISGDALIARDYLPYPSALNRFVAFDITTATNPVFLSDYSAPTTNHWHSRSEAFVAAGKIYQSYKAPTYEHGFLPVGRVSTPAQTSGTWIHKHLLQVIDYGDPAFPTPLRPINIPGTLIGLSHSGNVLYTQGWHWDPASLTTSGTNHVDASAYDGVSASLLDSVSMNIGWGAWARVDPESGHVFMARAVSTTAGGTTNWHHQLDSWRLDENGRFATVGNAHRLDQSPYNMRILNDLLIANDYSSHTFIDISDGTLGTTATWNSRGCIWSDLSGADGSAMQGVWLPHGSYGVSRVSPLADPMP